MTGLLYKELTFAVIGAANALFDCYWSSVSPPFELWRWLFGIPPCHQVKKEKSVTIREIRGNS